MYNSFLSGSGEVISRPPSVLDDGAICFRHRGDPSASNAAEHRRCPEERSGTQPTRGPASAGHAHPTGQEPGKQQTVSTSPQPAIAMETLTRSISVINIEMLFLCVHRHVLVQILQMESIKKTLPSHKRLIDLCLKRICDPNISVSSQTLFLCLGRTLMRAKTALRCLGKNGGVLGKKKPIWCLDLWTNASLDILFSVCS